MNQNRMPRLGTKRTSTRRLQLESLEDRRVLAAWIPQGPAPQIAGGTENVFPNDEVSGAIHVVLAHPDDADTLYVGTVNGGVWRTDNATDLSPDWEPLTDQLPVASISAMDMDANAPDRLIAGAGRPSAFADGGQLDGLMLTEDGGETWRIIDDPLLVERNFSGLAIDGDLILAAAGGGFWGFSREPNGGLFRSVDGGLTWTSIEVVERDPDNPDDPLRFHAFDLVKDPTNADRFYLAVQDRGVYVSEDRGETWTNVTQSSGDIDSLVTSDGNNNLEMAVANDGRVYISVVLFGQPNYIGYSDDQGNSWIAMDLPVTPDQPGTNGLNPKIKPGGQGFIHFSIVVDPDDPKTVYVGGDRQDGIGGGPTSGNFVGAKLFSGRLFRGDTRVTPDPAANPSPQWEHLTHSSSVGAIPEGGTRNSSAPHADSRDMVFDAAGNLIQVDDGGIYRRTSPEDNTGDWYSINGDLQVTEIHDIAYDSNTNTLIAGSQDNGSIQQVAPGSPVWQTVYVPDINFRLGGDGGDVEVDDTSLEGYSFRYSSTQFLGFFRRQLYDSGNNLIDQEFLPDPTFGSGTFVTPIKLNEIRQQQMVVAGFLGFFESFDRGDNFTPIPTPGGFIFDFGTDNFQNAIAYGGRRLGVEVPHILYAAAADEVLIRTEAGGELKFTQTPFPGAQVRAIVMDPYDWTHAFVTDRDRVYFTPNAGRTWQNITGNLGQFEPGDLRSLEAIFRNGTSSIVLGTDRGVFVTSAADPGRWTELGSLPHAPVYDLEYDSRDDALVVGTLGRGAFILENASNSGAADSFTNNSISGVKFNDLDGDGVRDAGETGNRWLLCVR